VEELGEARDYDYVVVNAHRMQAVAEVAAIIEAESRRPARDPDLGQTLNALAQDVARRADALEP
jgi:guanylate kinase